MNKNTRRNYDSNKIHFKRDEIYYKLYKSRMEKFPHTYEVIRKPRDAFKDSNTQLIQP